MTTKENAARPVAWSKLPRSTMKRKPVVSEPRRKYLISKLELRSNLDKKYPIEKPITTTPITLALT